MGIAVFPPSGAGLTTSDLIGADKIELIEEYKSTSNVTSITFSNIPQTYSQLLLVGNGITTAGDNTHIKVRPNNDSTSGNYFFESDWEESSGSGSHVFSVFSSSRTDFQLNTTQNNPAGNAYSFKFKIFNYTSNHAKMVDWELNYQPTGGYNRGIEKSWGSYRAGSTTNAITSLNLSTQVGSAYITIPSAVYSSLILYGVK